MLAKHVPFQDRVLFTLQQCLSRVLWHFIKTYSTGAVVSCHLPARRMKTRLWPWCCRNPLSLFLPLHARSPPQRILSGWPLKAACKKRGEVGLLCSYLLAPSPDLKDLNVLSKRHVEWEAMVDARGSPCTCFPGLNITLLINF